MTKAKTSLDISKLQAVFGEDIDLFLFYVTWIKNGLNGSKAYKELHPNVDDHSARVLGSRWLARVNKDLLLQAYGLDVQAYYKQLEGGLNAMKRDQYSGEMYEDHSARKPYHDKLGKMLGLENDNPNLTQINIGGELGVQFEKV